ncbi:MAG TPA: hypothetical protein VHH32_00885 [Gemmatimonadales bacterium]|nr:hypothetical protein [Gemmatimonadales bacterium]
MRTRAFGDIALTVLVFAAGVVLVILTVRSVPAWWTTKFEWPPPTLTTLALASGACIAFLITGTRVMALRLCEAEVTRVVSIEGDTVEVWEGTVADRPLLRSLGGRRSFITPWIWSFRAPDKAALARLLTALRDASVAFEGDDPKRWTPSDIFAQMREHGLVSGSYDEVGIAGVARKR